VSPLVRRARRVLLAFLPLATALASVPHPAAATAGVARSVPPKPDYPDLCAPAGVDTSAICLRLALAALDHARAAEGLAPARLPALFGQLDLAEQVFVAVDIERVDRGLAPFIGLTAELDADAQRGAERAEVPRRPGPGYRDTELEWIGDVANGLDAAYQWIYFDGPDAGVPGCGGGSISGCWADRRIVLGRFGGAGVLVMGVGVDPTAPAPGSAPSVAAVFARAKRPPPLYAYTWADALAAIATGTLQPLAAIPKDEAATGFVDPPRNVAPQPDYLQTCAPSGLDRSARCLAATVAAFDHARALEGVGPLVLPEDFLELSVPEQLFVVIDAERVDRGLAPFVGLTAALDSDAQRGADRADDPPDPGPSYLLYDGEWAGGSVNAVDAVYGWMYDDGYDSGNLDCLTRGAPGCWGHRKGILDNFGTGPDLVMGAALRLTHVKDAPSMAASLTVSSSRPRRLLYTWAQAEAAMPAAAGG
jgi:hypothetical protein